MSVGGATKKEVRDGLSLSYAHLRHYTAELVDRGLLRVDLERCVIATTDGGYAFFQRERAKIST